MPSSVPFGIDCGANDMTLLARVIGRDHVLAAIFQPFHRTAKPQRRKQNQNIFRIDFAAHAETAADMSLVAMQRGRAAAEHARQQFPVAMRDLGGAMKLKNIARSVVAADGAAGFERHAGMPADGDIDLDKCARHCGTPHRRRRSPAGK